MSRLALTRLLAVRSRAAARSSSLPSERAAAQLLYPADRRTVKAVPINPPIPEESGRLVGASGRIAQQEHASPYEHTEA
jgi:hypothetical protein